MGAWVKRLLLFAVLMSALLGGSTTGQAAVRRATMDVCPNGGRPMPPGTKGCTLRSFKVWYCRGSLQPTAIYGVEPRPGPACRVGIAYYAVYTA
jgi:hypothetical protein